MSRPTPETDAEIGVSYMVDGKACYIDLIHPNFARKLERERDEARDKAERYRIDANSLMLQRDRARFALQELWQFADPYLPQIDEAQSEKWHKAMFGDSEK